MVNRFLRTAPTRRLLGTLAGVAITIAGGAAIALASTSGGPVPTTRPPLAVAIRDALAATPVRGISADVNFTNNLLPSFEIQGSDPLLTSGSGHIWISDDGRMRLELYGDNGDPEIVLTHDSWWIYDPTLDTVYQGKLAPAPAGTDKTPKSEALPSVGQIQSELVQLTAHLNVSGAIPGDVGGQPTFTVKLSPKGRGGLIGQVQVAWDAIEGVPLRFAIYARGDSTPVLELAASNVSYGRLGSGLFKIKPPTGAHVVTVAMPSGASGVNHPEAKDRGGRRPPITGIRSVGAQLPFTLVAPPQLAGLSRQSVRLLDMGPRRGALLVYGQGLGAIAVIEQQESSGGQQQLHLSSGSGDGASGLTLPTVSINGATAQQLDTALGTILRFSTGGVSYTVLGSVGPGVADAAARGL